MFLDRLDAALQMATALASYKDKDVVVLGIPRGGVEIAYYVANQLEAELSIVVVRKLGHPNNKEYAFGAMAEDGTIYYNTGATRKISQEAIDAVEDKERAEIERRVKTLRKGKPLPNLHNKTVIIVDDGIATGSTIFCAIEMCRNQGSAKVVVAAPVAALDKKRELQQKADEVVILETPSDFYAVSQAYESFHNLSDKEALSFLERWEKENAKPSRQ